MQTVTDTTLTGTGAPIATQHVHVSWRAILAGILVAIAVDILLTLLGFAVGLTTFEPTAGAAKAFGIGVGLWLIITAVASVFAGAYFGARVAGDPWKTDGMAHGVVVWAAFLVLSLWLVASGVGKIFSAAGGLVSAAGGVAGGAAGAMMSPENRGQAMGAMSNLGVSRGDMEQRMNEARQRAANLKEPAAQQQAAEAAKEGAKKATEHVTAGGAAASWTAFGIALLTLGGGVVGGMLGAMGEQKQVVRYARRVAVEREHVSRASP